MNLQSTCSEVSATLAPAMVAADRPRRLPWPLALPAVPLFWVAPRRMGPVLSTVRWPGVLVASLFWTMYGVGWRAMVDGPLIGSAIAAMQRSFGESFRASPWGWVHVLSGHGPREPQGWALASQVIRSPLALFAEEWDQATVLGWEMAIGGGWAALAGILLAMISAPVLAPPEPFGPRTSRRIKLALLAITAVVPVAALIESLSLFGYRSRGQFSWALVLALGGWVYLLVRGGLGAPQRRGSPPQPQPDLLCEHCGYCLAGLPEGGRCPECGTPISESAPECRRRAPGSWLFSVKGAVFDRNFFRRIQLMDSGPARRLLGRTSLLSMALLWDAGRVIHHEDPALGALVGAGIACSMLVIGLLAAGPRLQGRPDPRRSTIWAYGLALIQGMLIVPALAVWAVVMLVQGRSWEAQPALLVGVGLALGMVVLYVYLALVVIARCHSAVRVNRFANA